MRETELHWLAAPTEWGEAMAESLEQRDPLPKLLQLANMRLDFVKTNQLDRLVQRVLPNGSSPVSSLRTLRLAILASSTIVQLLPGLRIAALRRGFFLQVYETGYGQYQQELLDTGSELYRFNPDVVLFALDSRHIIGLFGEGGRDAAADTAVQRLAHLWDYARTAFGCQIIQRQPCPYFRRS